MKVIKIEYLNEDGFIGFELFDNIEKAFKFYKKVVKSKMFDKFYLVEVNDNNIYYEDDGILNYEDNSELFKI